MPGPAAVAWLPGLWERRSRVYSADCAAPASTFGGLGPPDAGFSGAARTAYSARSSLCALCAFILNSILATRRQGCQLAEDPGEVPALLLRLITVIGMAAAPWGEELVAIPLGVGFGLPPLLVWPLAVTANMMPVLVLVWLFTRRRSRALLRDIESDADPAADPGHPALDTQVKRHARARALVDRWGLPGLALLAPPLTGVYVATAAALLLGLSPRLIIPWFAGSLAGWGAFATGLTTLGVRFLQ